MLPNITTLRHVMIHLNHSNFDLDNFPRLPIRKFSVGVTLFQMRGVA